MVSTYFKIWKENGGAVLAERCKVAGTYFLRLKGLLGTAALAPGDGLLLTPCWAIHTVGMRYPLDVVFLDGENRVLKVVAGLSPGRGVAYPPASKVLELPAGTVALTGTQRGDRLAIHPLPGEDNC